MIRWILAAVALLATPAATIAQPVTGSIEARLERVEAELAIRNIITNYAGFFNDRDYNSCASLFAPDGEYANADGDYKGQDAISRMLESFAGTAAAPNRLDYQIISNQRIDIDGDHATATSRYLIMMRGHDGAPMPSMAGGYRDVFVRLNGQWKIQRRVADDIIRPASEQWQKIIAAPKVTK